MNAFKKHGVSILKELSVERMHTYVLETLIPTMMARIEPGGIEEIDSSERDEVILRAPAAELSQETKDYLQSYGLSKGINCHSGAMDACYRLQI